VIWAVPILLAMMVVFPGAWAWYVIRRQLAATSVPRQRRLLRQVIAVSAGIGVAILAAGVAAFVLSGYDWPILALTWAVGLLHLSLLARTVRRLGTRTRAGTTPSCIDYRCLLRCCGSAARRPDASIE
jgi:hypothetical protein